MQRLLRSRFSALREISRFYTAWANSGHRRTSANEAGERMVPGVSCQDRPATKPDILGERQDVS
jgi:hypothetical protein